MTTDDTDVQTTAGGDDRLPRYGLACPTVEDMRRTLARIFGERQAAELWRAGCEGVASPDDPDLPLETVRVVCARIADLPGLPGIVGASLRIRCDTYLSLRRLAVTA